MELSTAQQFNVACFGAEAFPHYFPQYQADGYYALESVMSRHFPERRNQWAFARF